MATDEGDQLYKLKCFEPILVKYLTTYERGKACDTIMLLKENNNVDVKGRAIFNENYHIYGLLNRIQIVQL